MIETYTPFSDKRGIIFTINQLNTPQEFFTALEQNLSYFVSSGLVVDDLYDSSESVLRDSIFSGRRLFSYSVGPFTEEMGRRVSVLRGYSSEIPTQQPGAVVGFFNCFGLMKTEMGGYKSRLAFSIGDVRANISKFKQDYETTQRYVLAYNTFLEYMTSRQTKPQIFLTDFRLPEDTHAEAYPSLANYDYFLRALHRKVDPLITYPFVILGPSFDLDTEEPIPNRVSVSVCENSHGGHFGAIPDLEKVVDYLLDRKNFKKDELTGKTMGRTAVVFLPSPYDLGPYKEQLMEGLKEKRHIVHQPVNFE